MLRELSVQNLALIEDLQVELSEGFCAWTGETGAGKTLLLEALALLLGERGSADLIRAEADELRVTGRFHLVHHQQRAAVEQELNAPLEEGELILTRRLSRAGRSYAYANEIPVAVATLRRLRGLLVDVHGQRETQSLLEPAYQLRLLDAYGELDASRSLYQETAVRLRDLRKRHAARVSQAQERQRELALLQFQRDELDETRLLPGEVAELVRQRERLAKMQGLQQFLSSLRSRLYEDEGSVTEHAGKLFREANGWSDLDPALKSIAQRLDGLRAESQDLAETVRDLSQRWDADPARREEVEERLHVLRRLESKYHKSADELIAYRASLDETEASWRRQEEESGQLESELGEASTKLRGEGEHLSKQRRLAAQRLALAVQSELSELGMADARFEVCLTSLDPGTDPVSADCPQDGFDIVEFVLAANPGEPERPLRKVASGGELSRTMLALKTVLALQDQVDMIVFDEIDANVGGRLGDVLGSKLAALGRTRQVICVTHLPQVASFAPDQWTIRKVRQGKRTVTTIRLLAEDERLDELASMMRGEARGVTTRREAAAMLAAARGHWPKKEKPARE